MIGVRDDGSLQVRVIDWATSCSATGDHQPYLSLLDLLCGVVCFAPMHYCLAFKLVCYCRATLEQQLHCPICST